MFRIILLLSMLVASTFVDAQVIQIDSVEDNCIGGIHKVAEGDGIMTYYIKGATDAKLKTAQLVVKKISGGQNEAMTARVDVGKSAVVLKALMSNMGYCFLIAEPAAKQCYLLSTDMLGSVVNKLNIDGIDVSKTGVENGVRLMNFFPDGYMLVKPAANNKSYRLVIYSNDLKEQSDREITTRNNTIEVVNVKQMNDVTILVRKEQIDAKQQKYLYSVQVINAMDPAHDVITELKDDNKYCYATALNMQDANLYIAGLYYKDGKYVQGVPGGIAVYELQINGMIERKAYVAGEKLVGFLPDALISAMSMNSLLTVEDVVADIGKQQFCVVAEMMERTIPNAKAQEAKVKISDLLTMNISFDGELEKLTLAAKSPTLTINAKGALATADMYTTAMWLKGHELFNEKFVTKLGDKYFICIKSADSARSEAEAIFIRADNPVGDNHFGITLTRMPSQSPLLKGRSTFNITSGNADKKIKLWQHVQIVNINANQVAIFNQLDDRIGLYYERLVPPTSNE